MEVLAALGLVCNIVQLTETATKAIVLCKQVYENGASVQQYEFAAHHDQLQLNCSALTQKLENSHQGQDVRVRKIAEKYLETSEDLKNELAKLDHPSPGSVRRLGKALKAPWRAKRIDKIKAELDDHQKFLDTQILIQLSLQVRESSICTHASFPVDDQQLRAMAMRLEKGQATTNDLMKAMAEDLKIIQRQVEQTNQSIERMKNLHISELRDKAFNEFTASLSFPEMYRRQEAIDENYKKTFEWIYSEQDHGRWPSFARWLASNENFYWLLGKPGSGKSTLMNFVYDDARTYDLLSRDTAQPPLIAKFFFWEAGSSLEKSVSGLLRSLLLQIFRGPDKLELRQWIFDKGQPLEPSFDKSGLRIDGWVWSYKRLLSTFKDIQKQISRRSRYFIDGLDECDDPEALTDLIQTIKSYPNVKLCVSSRPLRLFELNFSTPFHLRLQDLTRSDIETYARGRLSKDMPTHLGASWSSSTVEEFTQQVSTKAEGVFLWVKIVVNLLLEGRRNEDELPLLHKRLQSLPADIFDLYHNMWSRTKSEHDLYGKLASLYFHIILIKELSLASFALAIDEKLLHDLLQEESLRNNELLEDSLADYAVLRPKLMVRCAGLLEILDNTDSESTEKPSKAPSGVDLGVFRARRTPAEDVEAHNTTRIAFIHRTARDFLLQDNRGKEILANLPDGQYEAWGRQCKVFLIERVLNLSPLSCDVFENFARQLFHKYPEYAKRYYEEHKMSSPFSMTALLEEKMSRLVAYRTSISQRDWYRWICRKHSRSINHRMDSSESQPLFLYDIILWADGCSYTGFEFVIRGLENAGSSFAESILTDMLSSLLCRGFGHDHDLSAFSNILKLLLKNGANPNQVLIRPRTRADGCCVVSDPSNPGINLISIWLDFLMYDLLSPYQTDFQTLLSYGAGSSGSCLFRETIKGRDGAETMGLVMCKTALEVVVELRDRDKYMSPAKSDFFIKHLTDLGSQRNPVRGTWFILLQLGAKWCEVSLEDSCLLNNLFTRINADHNLDRLEEEFRRTGGLCDLEQASSDFVEAHRNIEDEGDGRKYVPKAMELLSIVCHKILSQSVTHMSAKDALKPMSDKAPDWERFTSNLVSRHYVALESPDWDCFIKSMHALHAAKN